MKATRLSAHNVTSGSFVDAAPRIKLILSQLEPDDPIGTPVGTASVVNSDDASHAFALVTNPSGLFQIDGVTGAITLASVAVAGDFELYIQATGSPSGDVLLRRVPFIIGSPLSPVSSSILPHILLNQQQLGISL